jgi:hypothetical protein
MRQTRAVQHTNKFFMMIWNDTTETANGAQALQWFFNENFKTNIRKFHKVQYKNPVCR